MAVLRQGGVRLWTASVSGFRVGRVYSEVGDFASDPVIDGQSLYVATQSGRLAAYELNTGQRTWTAQIGSVGPIALAAGSIWLNSDDGRLVRINARTGDIVWARDLPYFTESRIKRR